MLSLFRRRKGRHQLGAAVTSIPGLPAARPLLPPDLPVPAPVPHASAAPAVEAAPDLPMPPEAAAFLGTPNPLVPQAVSVVDAPPTAVAEPPAPAVDVPAGPRVELGFRDGSRAALDPSSEQARALEDLASVLTRRD